VRPEHHTDAMSLSSVKPKLPTVIKKKITNDKIDGEDFSYLRFCSVTRKLPAHL
jgi:hypothetical protein